MINIESLRQSLRKLPPYIKGAEFNIEKITSCTLRLSNSKTIGNSYSDITEVFVRASGNRTGFAYTQDLSEDPNDLIIRAYNNSLDIESTNINILNTSGQSEKLLENTIVDIQEMSTYASILEEELKNIHDSIDNVIVESRVDIRRSSVLNSFLMDKTYERKVCYLSAHITSKYEGKVYNVSCAMSAQNYSHINMDEMKEQALNQLISQFNAISYKSGTYSCVLDKTVMVNIMMTAWQLFSGIKYEEGALSGCLNSLIGSESFTLVDSPAHHKTGYHYEFDCEGTDSDENILVEKGYFKGLMHNLFTSHAMGHKPTGNAGRYALLSGTIPTDIIIIPRILYIKPGEKNRKDLLKQLNDGVYITESYDVFHSINISSGNFSIPCRGTVIRNGERAENITEMTISGNLAELFKSINEVGNDIYIEEFLKKSYCIGSASVIVNNLNINAG